MPSEIRRRRILGITSENAAMTRRAMGQQLQAMSESPFLGDLIAEYPRRGGAMVPSSLFLTVHRMFKRSLEPVLGLAAAIELMNTALLVHRDLAEQRRMRWGEPSLEQLAGLPLALNAGDALVLLSLRPILQTRQHLGVKLSMQCLREVEQMMEYASRGSFANLRWHYEGARLPGLRAYLSMLFARSSWPSTIAPLRLGILCAERGRVDPDLLTRFGFFYSVAMELRATVRELETMLENRGGEVARSPIRTNVPLERLRHCLQGADRRRLVALLGTDRERWQKQDLSWLTASLRRHRCVSSTLRFADEMSAAAEREVMALIQQGCIPLEGEMLAGFVRWVDSGD